MTSEIKHESVESKIIARALKDEAFKQALLNNPALVKAEIEKELGEALPEDLSINVVQESPNIAYIVLPFMPIIEGMTQEQLQSCAGGLITRTAIRPIKYVPNHHHHDKKKR